MILVRKDDKGQRQRRQLDLKKMMSKGHMSRNEPLQEGDVIYVPNRKPKSSLMEFGTLLYPLSGLLNLLRF